MAFMATGATDINTHPVCYRATDSDMAIVSSLGSDDPMAPSSSTGHSDHYILPWLQYAPWTPALHRLHCRSQTNEWYLLATWTMVLCSSLCLYVTVAPGGSTGHTGEFGSSISMALNTNMAPDCGPDPGNPNGSHGNKPLISTQTLAAVGPWIFSPFYYTSF